MELLEEIKLKMLELSEDWNVAMSKITYRIKSTPDDNLVTTIFSSGHKTSKHYFAPDKLKI